MMKNLNILLLLITSFFLNSCEEVVDVELNTAPPKLVIEASINWLKGTLGNTQTIKLTTTTSFYSSNIPVVSGAKISIKNSSNTIFDFIEKPNTGEYICSKFIPVLNETYTLTITVKGATYTATETMKSVTAIDEIVQNNQGGFTGKDIELKSFYTDPANETNFYLYKYSYLDKVTQSYYADEDTFFQGNTFFSISQNNDIKSGEKVKVTHFGISKEYYNYMKVLINIAGSSAGSPFQSPPATVRGNIINITNKTDYPLGYFSLSEADSKTYTVK